MVSVLGSDPTIVYSEVSVESGYNTVETAQVLMQVTLTELITASIDFSTILNDGLSVPVSYLWDNRSDSFSETEMQAAATFMADQTRGATSATNTPRAQTFTCPASCAAAVEMGLSEVEAATCSNLDRDNDGLACYGD